ncbi:MAG: PilZ domain-containing protein [Rhodospirillaceae bacterium]|nr:PilZ domain-containing protein [Rhodospirillaceae bacterium]
MAPDPVNSIRPEGTTLAGHGGGGDWGDRPLRREAPRRPAADPEDIVVLSPDAERAVAGAAQPPLLPLGWLVRLGHAIGRLWFLLTTDEQVGDADAPPQQAPPGRIPSFRAARPVDPRDRRLHQRVLSKGCTVRIDSQVYEILDVSLGGFTFGPDRGALIANQRFYFELSFHGDPPVRPVRADGTIVRVANGIIAAKFFLPLTTTQRLIAEFVARNMD